VSAEYAARLLADADPLVRRAAVVCVADHGDSALPHLAGAAANSDVLVRRNVALLLGTLGPAAVDVLGRLVTDEEALVRHGAVEGLAMVRPRSSRALALLTTASSDVDRLVRAAALHAADQYLKIAAEIRLPREGWKFRLDAAKAGEAQGWHKPDLDDSDWADIGIEKAWGQCGYEGYIGTAWYRRDVDLPPDPGGTRVTLNFMGVDECAWVWVNGRYAGEHDIGPSGWNEPFRLDVTKLVKWGGTNQITVRAMNTAAAGGIWRPIWLVASTLGD
jgi:hypothetical protein